MMASIFMIDCHFVMFCSNSPCLTPAELSFDLPAEENGIQLWIGKTVAYSLLGG